MDIFDISVPINQHLPTWPGDPVFDIKTVSKIEDGDIANVSHLSLGVHTGTHVDAPRHFILDGAPVDKIPLDNFVGSAIVVELMGVDIITAKDIQKNSQKLAEDRIIFKTKNSLIWEKYRSQFYQDFVALSPDAAQYLVDLNLKLVGIDYLSIAPYTEPTPTHKILLGAGIPILEGVNLSGIEPGPYRLFCLPLNLVGVDGAPARAILSR